MKRRILSLMLALCAALPFKAAYASEKPVIIISDEFSSYAENCTETRYIKSISGVDTRVLSDGGNKVLFSRAFDAPAILRAAFSCGNENLLAVSAGIKVSGDGVSGKLFNITFGSKKLAMLRMDSDGSVKLFDGKRICGVPKADYRRFTVILNFKAQEFDVYVDGKCEARGWRLPKDGGYANPTAVDFSVDYNEKEADIYLDDFRIYAASASDASFVSFPSEKINDEVLPFEETKVIDESVKILYDEEFKNGIQNVTKSVKGGAVGFKKDADGNGTLSFFADKNTPGGSYIDITCEKIAEMQRYVLDTSIKINELSGDAALGIADAKTNGAPWRRGYSLSASGKLTSYASGGTAGEIAFGEWVRFSCIYDISAGKADVYINGVYASTNSIPTDYMPTVFRFDLINGSGVHDTQINYIRIYSGNKLCGDGVFEDGAPIAPKTDEDIKNLPTVMDPADKLKDALEGKIVLMPSNSTFCINGEKTKAGEELKPFTANGVIMIPQKLFELFSEETVLFDSESGKIAIGTRAELFRGEKRALSGGREIMLSAPPEEKNGILYFPLRSVFESIMGKHVLWDNRGFAVISGEALKAESDYHYLDRYVTWKPMDLIYRYMQFENPNGKEIIAAVKENFPNNAHPRILYTESDINYILDMTDKDAEWKKAYEKQLEAARTSYYRAYKGNYAATADSSKQAAAGTFCNDILNLAAGYLLTGDTKYAERGVEAMKEFAAWDSLACSTSNLITGYWATGMGVGFDAFYNYMASSKQGVSDMKYLKERIRALAYADHIAAYSGGGELHYITMQDNFIGVTGGGMLSLTLALCDEEDMEVQSAYIAENLIKTAEIETSLFFPNGGYYESISYADYLFTYFEIGLQALFNCCKTDYALGSAPGFADAGDFFTYAQSAENCFSFHDCKPGYYGSTVREFMGYRYGRGNAAAMAELHYKLIGEERSLRELFFAGKSAEGTTENAPLDYYFKGAEVGTFANTRTGGAPVMAGFHGGYTGVPHSMLDLGQFSFESDATLWACDLGSDSYSLPSYFSTQGYRIYRKRTEGKNCVVINPSEDTENYYGQKIGAFAGLTKFESGNGGAVAAYDLSEAYERDAVSYERGYMLADGRTTFTVRDEIKLRKESEIYWFMHTPADIEILSGNEARLVSKDKTRSLTVKALCSAPGFKLMQMAAEPLADSPRVEGQADNEGYTKLALHIPKANGNVNITVKLIPDEYKDRASGIKDEPISKWRPEAEMPARIPTLTSLKLDGKDIDGFFESRCVYREKIYRGETSVPYIEAHSDNAEIYVKQAKKPGDTAVITLKGNDGGIQNCFVTFEATNERKITVTDELFNVLPKTGAEGELLTPVSAEGETTPEPQNGADKAIDGDLNTKYAQRGIGVWYEFDLGKISDIDGVCIAFADGDKRENYVDLLYSEDGENYKRVWSGASNGKTAGYETLKIPGRVRYIRIIGNGNSTSVWNSISEVRAVAKGGAKQ